MAAICELEHWHAKSPALQPTADPADRRQDCPQLGIAAATEEQALGPPEREVQRVGGLVIVDEDADFVTVGVGWIGVDELPPAEEVGVVTVFEVTEHEPGAGAGFDAAQAQTACALAETARAELTLFPQAATTQFRALLTIAAFWLLLHWQA
jgi:hypothetical protein